MAGLALPSTYDILLWRSFLKGEIRILATDGSVIIDVVIGDGGDGKSTNAPLPRNCQSTRLGDATTRALVRT